MACTPLDPASCVSAAAGAAAASLGNSFADAMREGATWVIRTTIGWWVEVPAIDLTSSPAGQVRADVWWLALVVATAGVAWQGMRMAISHRRDPLVDIGRGLVTLALWAAIGITGPALALRAGDSFSRWVLDRAASGQVADRLVQLAGLQTITSAGAAIVLGLLVMIAGLAQAVLMMFREGAVVVLAGVLVLAAAGNATRYGRPWLTKVLGWMLALITYKPVAALVYAVALTLTGAGTDPRTVVVGLAMIVMSVIALPVLMRFFTWATGSTGGGPGGLSGLLGSSAAGVQAGAALRGAGSGGGGDAGAHAAQLRSDLGPAASSVWAAPSSTGGGGSAAAAGGAASTAAPRGAATASAGAGASAAGAAAAGAATGGAAAAALAAQAAADTAVQGSRAAGSAMTDHEESA